VEKRSKEEMSQSRIIVPLLSRDALLGMIDADRKYNQTAIEWDYALELLHEVTQCLYLRCGSAKSVPTSSAGLW
jgi:hypothetical protein